MERRRVFFSFAPAGCAPVTDSDEDRAWRERNTELHPFREIMVILGGEFQFQLASHLYAGRVGDIVLFDAFEKHDRFHPPSVHECITMWIHCYPHTMLCTINMGSDTRCWVLMRFEFPHREFCMLLNRVWRDAASGQKPPEVARLEIGGVIDVIMGAFAERIINSGQQSMRFSEAQNRQYLTVMAAMAYIGEHLNENPQLGDLARTAGYSTPHFARLFRQYAGYGFRDYVDFVRLRMYRKMYFVKHMHKKEIAVELGFSSSSSLIHWLRIVQNKQEEKLRAAKKDGGGDE